MLAEVGGQIEALLGDRIYSRNGDSLEVTAGEMLRRQRATLAVAESVTAGGLADRITGVPGASDYFVGGFITYSRAAKTELLGVEPELLQRFGPVSREVAEAMAVGARRRTGATHALSITGNAGPTTDGDQAPLGMVYIGLASASGVTSTHRQFLGDRPRIRAFAGQTGARFSTPQSVRISLEPDRPKSVTQDGTRYPGRYAVHSSKSAVHLAGRPGSRPRR